MAIGMAVVTGGATHSSPPPVPPASTYPPATSTSVPPPPPPGVPYTPATLELSDADLDEPFCPERSDQGPGASDGDPHTLVAEATRLEPMLGVVLAYGTEHADSFGSYGLHWHTSDDASVYISFTQNIATHRAALLELVPLPEELIVCRAAISGDDVRVLHQELVQDLEGRFTHVGMGNGRVTVGLYAPDEAIAADLVARYGDAVEVTVGMFPYPMPDPLPESLCEPIAAPAPGLELASARGGSESVALGDVTTEALDLTLTNTTETTIEFIHGVWIGRLTRRGDTLSAAHFVGSVAAIGYTLTLEPGDSEAVSVSIPTASCDPAVGYQVPPDDYDLYIVVDPGGPTQNVPDAPFSLGPVPITITPP